MNLLMAPTISKAKGHKLLGNQCAKGRAAKLLRIFEFVKAYFTEQLLWIWRVHWVWERCVRRIGDGRAE